MTSDEIRSSELDLSAPGCTVRVYATSVRADALDGIVTRRAAEDPCWGSAQPVPGDRDRTLVAAAVAYAAETGRDVIIVTNDEVLLKWAQHLAVDYSVELWAENSYSVLGMFLGCGALTEDELDVIFENEVAFQRSRTDVSQATRLQKELRMREAIRDAVPRLLPSGAASPSRGAARRLGSQEGAP